MRLTGVVQSEMRFGTPNYGENPDTDERLRILTLQLSAPIEVCADTTREAPGPRISALPVVQLLGGPNHRWWSDRIGRTLSIDGTLMRRVFGSHFYEVLIHVDSVRPAAVEPGCYPDSRAQRHRTSVTPNW